jgi:hypothetical protein
MIAVLFLTLAVIATAAAAPAPPPSIFNPPASAVDNSNIKLGVLWANFHTNVRVDSASGTKIEGTPISMEDLLGLKSKEALFIGSATWRSARKWNWDFEYSNVPRTHTIAPGTPLSVTFNGVTYDITSSQPATTKFNTPLFSLRWRYSFYDHPATRIGLALGIGGFYLNSSIMGTPPDSETVVTKTANAPIPIPEIGLKLTQRIADKTFFNVYYNYFLLKYKGYEGNASDLDAGFDYLFTRHLGLSLNYMYKAWNLSSNSGSVQGNFNYRVSGPALTANYYF